jgi:hypothetical protein
MKVARRCRLGSDDFAKVIADEYGMYKGVIESLKK